MPHYSLFAFSADKLQYKETVRLELMHFLPLLGAGKVGEVGRGENIQPTGQQCTEDYNIEERIRMQFTSYLQGLQTTGSMLSMCLQNDLLMGKERMEL